MDHDDFVVDVILHVTLYVVFSYVAPTSDAQTLVLGLMELAFTAIVECAVIRTVFKARTLRAVQAWLTTLMATVIMLALGHLVLQPFVYEEDAWGQWWPYQSGMTDRLVQNGLPLHNGFRRIVRTTRFVPATQDIEQNCTVDRFADVVTAACIQTDLPVFDHGVCSKCNDWADISLLTQTTGCGIAIQFWHLHVHQNQVNLMALLC